MHDRATPLPKKAPRRLIVAGAIALLALAVTVACGGDSEPEPAPTPAPATASPPETASPEPDATPSPDPEATPTTATATPPPEAAGPPPSMRDFVVDQSTTGQDLLDRLSEEEVACIQEAVGDTVFQFLRVTPLLAGTGDPSAAAPIFGCMTQENAVLAGAAFLDAAAGGRSEESRLCVIELSLRHPDIIYARLGLEWTGEQQTDPSETQTVMLDFLDCLTDPEKAAWLLDIFSAVDALSPITGTDLIALLPESEATCVQDTLSAADYEAMRAATPLAAAGIALDAAACLTVDSVSEFTVAATAAALGGLSDESSACVREFTLARPTYLQVVASQVRDPSTLTAEQFAETAGGGFEMLDCLNEGELTAINDMIAALATQ